MVGSGNGALTAAICAHEMGLANVLVVEKGDQGMKASTAGVADYLSKNVGKL